MMQHLQPNTTLQSGKYRIERVLGQGGFGRVLIGVFLILFPVFVMAQASGGQIKRKSQVSTSTNRVSRSNNKPSKPGMTEPERKAIIANIVNNMVFVEGGTFVMGELLDDQTYIPLDPPSHNVSLSSFYIGKYEITQEEWIAVMGENPSVYKTGMHCPVEQVSWFECQKFISNLNHITNMKFRLPTEAEWEFAARGGTKSKGYKYSGSNRKEPVAWWYYCAICGDEPIPREVGKKQPNELGLYDMSGNVEEWCEDWWADYSSEDQINPIGPPNGNNKVVRGGDIRGTEPVNNRGSHDPKYPSCSIGFRLAK